MATASAEAWEIIATFRPSMKDSAACRLVAEAEMSIENFKMRALVKMREVKMLVEINVCGVGSSFLFEQHLQVYNQP